MEKITAASAESKSLDITAQNIEKLKTLFPDVFSEGSIDFEALKAVLGEAIDDSAERYNFTWNGKNKARQIAQTPSTGTLRPCKEESVNWDSTENLFIEGDNLEVLKLLQKSYHRKVKMIYIDPPYNTGKDFVYKDNFHDNIKNYLEVTGQVDSEGNKLSTNSDTSGRYHSDWLNMIYPRLKLAKNLLCDDGVIFISIDDNELANLLEICDEVFGSNNRRGIVSRPTGTPSGQGYDILVNEIDYILVYSKSSSSTLKGLPFSPDDEKIYDQEDEFGRFLTRTLRKTGGEDRKEDRPTMYYGIKGPDGNLVYPIGPGGYDSRWRCGEDSYFKLISENRIQWKQSADGDWKPYQKFYLEGRLKQASNLWQGIEGNKKASLTIKELFNGKAFDTPKPVGLIKRCLQLATTKNDIVLDFFAGSSTTAHAVIDLNIEDGGNRKFIMVQLPEPCGEKSEAYGAGYKTISEVSIQRIKRVCQQEHYSSKNNSTDFGFKVMKLDKSNIHTWESDFDNLEHSLLSANESIKADRSAEDVLYEILLKYGIELTVPVELQTIHDKQVFVVGAGALLVCLADDITTDVVEGIAQLKQKLDPETTQVVFKDAGFADSVVKTNAIQILKQAGIDDVKSI
ncbi:DNA methylase N-4 [Aeromonas allosaccharophila]|uniref:site-specific DNA-methyltransferase n=1 Tax=Aeromonas allosaccharophila TaxID=656 RepID=UPI00071803F6|nr:site-specific DNA-methyltransferase [Aeromonas allosaccharophila]KRW57875.1 DNA methylase N-4 [Aeromonas allosaccharophila]